MRVRALDRFEYAHKDRVPGEEFDTDNDEHARLLELMKHVEILPRDMKADSKRNRYRHRAMQADE